MRGLWVKCTVFGTLKRSVTNTLHFGANVLRAVPDTRLADCVCFSVGSQDTGKALSCKRVSRRVTIVPLNKVVDPTIHPNTVRTAQSVAPAGSELYPALQIIGYDREVQSAMKYVFGGFLVCDTPETAKKATFHPNVKVRSVTKDGDIYDPAGTLTGGSAPKGGGLLVKLQELGQLEQQLAGQQRECAKVQAQLQGMRCRVEVH